MYEKSVTKIFTPFSILALQGDSVKFDGQGHRLNFTVTHG